MPETLRINPQTTIDLRPAVEVREFQIGACSGWYLSLFGDEIDERTEALREFLGTESGFKFSQLELTDAVIFTSGKGDIRVARGGACTVPLYWSQTAQGLRLNTRLPVGEGIAVSRSGLLSAVTSACSHSSYEPNAIAETPLVGWSRVRRGRVTQFVRGQRQEECLISPEEARGVSSYSDIVRTVQSALRAYGHSQRHVRRSLVEVSGGFDSTIAAAFPPQHTMHGISVAFPFYEFRFENETQLAVTDALGIPRVEVDGTVLFPYSPADTPAKWDEPSVFVTGIRHAETVARHAKHLGAERIYMGHGGDQIFGTDLLASESPAVSHLESGLFRSGVYARVSQTTKTMRDAVSADRRLGTFVYDARQDVWVKETFGPTIRSPFSDLRLFRAGLAWSQYCAEHSVKPSKAVLADAAGSLLPRAVRERKGKVAYDGVWARAYRTQAPNIIATFERTAPILEQIGIRPQWLVRRTQDLADWKACSGREVLGAYSISYWLNSWGITDPQLVSWGI